MPNRLAGEQSPYLLQHAHNPVDWYPWSAEAFETARAGNKPIFLSVGYSTCHWCHVMEHESFESAEIAAVLNDHFVPVKVDREERPDVDRVYMSFVQATTGSGGWPMSVWLTPDLKPFYGGTYFPPSGRWGRPGFIDILKEIAQVWAADQAKVLASAEELFRHLKEASTPSGSSTGVAGPDSLGEGVDEFVRTFDARHGGFGGSPKFPRPTELLFLLREHVRTSDARARDIVLKTLSAMAVGGMRDHIGGGFHRYSVDAEWRVPHFEKMLYDQAQLTVAYLEAAQLTADPFFAAVAEDTLRYVQRDLTHPDGGFYSAEDADSVPPEQASHPKPHKTEGAFYVWSETEIRTLLGDDADIVRFRFGIEPAGNAPQDPHGEFVGKNILYTARSIEEVARLAGRSPEDVIDALGRARRRLFDARQARPRPHLDDKVLTGWNGLMIAAFARAARVLGHGETFGAEAADRAKEYLVAARRAASFVREALWQPEARTLFRRYRNGESAIDAYCEDYASLVWGLLELFQADGDPAWLAWALQLAARQDELFWDPVDRGWFSTSGRDATVLLRLKEDYDGAEPSAGSLAAQNLLALSHLATDVDSGDRLVGALARIGPALGRAARVVPLMACVLSAYHAGVTQVVVAGDPDDDRTKALLGEVAAQYRPFALVIPAAPASQAALAEVAPLIAAMKPVDGTPTAYVCRDFTCRAPVQDAAALRAALQPA